MTEDVNSYYAESAIPEAPCPTRTESLQCDVWIVGGGDTVVSAALHLGEQGYDVVLLEAARIGVGASGRNGGQGGNSDSRGMAVIEGRYGAETTRVPGGRTCDGS
ncbi:hypothetical protein ER21_12705 [Cronobacter sakazakii]|nr:hypothetical protein ER21_12705 [Cronobacter sakazakii]